ncbi:MAG: GAF domain-containing protein [Anaerolineae bacterium]|jgi:adenylate cyclase|nr:GAF domain-containing protein [Anaerolineae bacterium]
MASPIQHYSAQEEARRLGDTVNKLIDTLRAQRTFLRQQGMGLPPGTLNGFKAVQTGLEKLTQQLIDANIELEQLRALAETTALINSSLDADQVLNEVMDTVIALTGAERGYIMLRNKRTGQMEFRIARNLDRKSVDEGSFIVSRTIVDEVAQTGHPVVTTNAQSDPRFSAQESVLIYALRSILCVPLIVKDEITGVVYADNRIKDGLFGEKELSLLVAFANQAAVAIENARLFQGVQTALAEITEMKELMDNVFASITSGVITTDADERVTTYNVAAEQILIVPFSTAIGNSLAQALPIIYAYVENLIDVIYQHSYQELIEIDTELPRRGAVNLNLKLTPLKNAEDITEGVAIVVDDLTEIKKRDATLDVVRRYLPPAMLDNIESIDGLGLGGERRVVTVMFVETRPFETFPVDLAPHDLMELLNLYLSVGAEAIHLQTGVIDKFMGNEIMGLFNTQLNPSDDHAWWAVQAALKMADDYIALAEHIGEEPIPYYRIGIHTGVATLGNVGSTKRREFTAIGDTVNLAKRLQENAQYGHMIISDETYRHCHQQLSALSTSIQVVERPSIQVKGRRQAAKIYEILPCHR